MAARSKPLARWRTADGRALAFAVTPVLNAGQRSAPRLVRARWFPWWSVSRKRRWIQRTAKAENRRPPPVLGTAGRSPPKRDRQRLSRSAGQGPSASPPGESGAAAQTSRASDGLPASGRCKLDFFEAPPACRQFCALILNAGYWFRGSLDLNE
ncbi:MAG: hypothetical protein M2R45_02833 [Verrucomicrobia subdivision 3 bacterium]|nr:hypothetical protein [Limisphaerales bacterium]MCS1415463.1 hypothetical protein [Limisphaerales bacterium]